MITTVIITLDILSMSLIDIHTIVLDVESVDNFYFYFLAKCKCEVLAFRHILE